MSRLGEEIRNLCHDNDLSLSQACKLAGIKYSTLHAQISNDREIPFSTIDKLSAALNIPLSQFSETPHAPHNKNSADILNHVNAAQALADLMAEQVAAMAEMGYQIGTDDVLDWLTANNNRLVNCDWLIERINLYYPAQVGDSIPRPYRIGAQSLSSKYFHMLNTTSYSDVMDKFDQTSREEIIQAHLDVADMKYLITDRKIDAISDDGRVRGTYRRLLAPVVDEEGRRLTLAFSKLTHFSSR